MHKHVRDFNIETKRSIIRLNQLGGGGGMTSLVYEFGHGMRWNRWNWNQLSTEMQ